jgi:hypothetical protein
MAYNVWRTVRASNPVEAEAAARSLSLELTDEA